MTDEVLARLSRLESRVRRLESSAAPPLPQEQSGGRTPERDIIELIRAILRQHGRRLDLAGADDGTARGQMRVAGRNARTV